MSNVLYDGKKTTNKSKHMFFSIREPITKSNDDAYLFASIDRWRIEIDKTFNLPISDEEDEIF